MTCEKWWCDTNYYVQNGLCVDDCTLSPQPQYEVNFADKDAVEIRMCIDDC